MDRGRARCEEELRNWIPVRYRVYKARERERHIAHAPRCQRLFMEAVFHQETKNSCQSLRGTTRAHQTERPRPQKGQDLHRHHWKPNCNVGQTTATLVVVKLPSQGQKGALPGCQSGSASGAGGRQTCLMRQLWLSVTLHFRIVLDVLCCLGGSKKATNNKQRHTHNKHTHTPRLALNSLPYGCCSSSLHGTMASGRRGANAELNPCGPFPASFARSLSRMCCNGFGLLIALSISPSLSLILDPWEGQAGGTLTGTETDTQNWRQQLEFVFSHCSWIPSQAAWLSDPHPPSPRSREAWHCNSLCPEKKTWFIGGLN